MAIIKSNEVLPKEVLSIDKGYIMVICGNLVVIEKSTEGPIYKPNEEMSPNREVTQIKLLEGLHG